MAETAPVGTQDEIALYVHWPFCKALCPYCDFNSHVRDTVDHARWRNALVAELEHYAARTGPRRLTSIFFGGGTPSLMAPDTAQAVIGRARSVFAADDDLEITLEANPTSAERDVLEGFARAGINRVSLGVQALDDAALSALGRTHSTAEARAAIAAAQDLFTRMSFDLIYARPGQNPAQWDAELAGALELARGHLSAYQLTIEPGTPFYLAAARGALVLPEEEEGARMYEITQRRLSEAGLPAYEISNHAVPGEESRHNLAYWHHTDYAGIGPGAHGRIAVCATVRATRQHRAPEIWLERVERDGHATQQDDALTQADLVEEVTMMGLRLTEGLDAAAFAARTGTTLDGAFDPATITRLVDGGFVEYDDGGLRATGEGRQRLNAVVASLLGSP